MDAEVRVLHEAVWPQRANQVIFFKESSSALKHQYQKIEGLGGKWYDFVAPPYPALPRV